MGFSIHFSYDYSDVQIWFIELMISMLPYPIYSFLLFIGICIRINTLLHLHRVSLDIQEVVEEVRQFDFEPQGLGDEDFEVEEDEALTLNDFDEGISLLEEDAQFVIRNLFLAGDYSFDDYDQILQERQLIEEIENFLYVERFDLGQWFRDLTQEGIEPNPGPSQFFYMKMFLSYLSIFLINLGNGHHISMVFPLLYVQLEIIKYIVLFDFFVKVMALYLRVWGFDFPLDLTRFGIEPNPGPIQFCLECGRDAEFCCGMECEGFFENEREPFNSNETLCYDNDLSNVMHKLSQLGVTNDVDTKIQEIIEYYKEKISHLTFETQMKNMGILSAKSCKERERISNELKRLIKLEEKKLTKLREKQRDFKKYKFQTQMFPSIKLDLSERTKDLLDELNETMNEGLKVGLDESTRKLLETLNGTVEKFRNSIESNPISLIKTSVASSLLVDFVVVLILTKLFFIPEYSVVVKGVVTSIVTIYLGAKYGYRYFKTQMDEGEFKGLTSMITFLLHSILIATIPNTKGKFSKAMDFFSNYGKIIDNFENGFSSVLLYIEKIINIFKEQVFQTEGITFLESKDEDLNSWLERAGKFVSNFQQGDKRVNIDRSMEVSTLKRQAYELEQKYGNLRNKSLLYGKFLYLFAYIKKICDLYEDLDFANHSARVLPVAACFMSAPGCGKTFPVTIMGQSLLAHSLPIEELSTFKKNPWVYMYASQGSLGYDDGMNGSEKVFLDSEFLQARQVPGVLTENLEFITDVDTFPKQAHMAEAHKKGRIMKNPWFVVKCTNNMNFKDNKDDITEANAVWRRFGRHIYFVGVDDKYCTEETLPLDPWLRRIDYNKCPLQWSPEVQKYYRIDLKHQVQKVLTFDEIIQDMLEDHEFNKRKHQAYLKTSDSRINDIINQRMKTQMLEEDNDILDPSCDSDQILILFQKYGIPKILLKRYLKWLEGRPRSPDDHEIQILVFMSEYEETVPIKKEEQTFMSSIFDSICSISKSISDRLERFHNDYSGLFTMIQTISMITGIFGTIGLITNCFPNSATEEKQNFEIEMGSGTLGKGKKGNKSKKARKRFNDKAKKASHAFRRKARNFRTEGGHDYGSHEMMMNVYKKNMYELFLPERGVRSGFVLFLRNRVFLMPLHFHRAIERRISSGQNKMTDCVTLKKCGTDVSLSLPMSHMMKIKKSEYEGEDYCLAEASIDFPLHRDIVSYFCEDKLYDTEFDQYGSLVCPGAEGMFEKTNSTFQIVDDIGHGNDHEDYYNMISLVYNIDTRNGDCGAPFFLRNASVQGGRLMGIHISGTDVGHGMSVVVTRDEIEEMIDDIDSVKVKSFDYNFTNQSDFPAYFAGTYPIGRHPSQVRNPTKTKIVSSLLSGIFGKPKTKPARLAREYDDSGDLVFDPFMKGLIKNIRSRPSVNLSILEACEHHLFSTLVSQSSIVSSVGKRTLTFDQAVLGIPEISFCDSIPRNTSAGYPYAMPGGICEGKPGKSAFFGEGQIYDLQTPACVELRERVQKRMENLKNGIRNEVIFMDFAKDERRPIAKVDEGKTRMINACPLDHLIEVRQLFMAFAMWIQSNRIDNGICVGINPYSDEWHKLATKLKSKGSAVDAGDFSEFDYSELSSFLWSILHIINRWYNDEDGNNKARETAWYEVVNSVHINGSYVYHLVSSLPSGHPLTVIINSMYVQLAFRYVWVLLHRENVSSLENFNDHLYIASYGDDNVHNKSFYAQSIMSEERLIELFSVIGLKYTNEKKDTEIRKFRTLADVSFLKRDFRFESSIMKYVAPLSLETLLEFVYWTKKGSQSEVITKQNVDNCMMELSLHDPIVFDKYSSTLLKNAMDKLNYCPTFFSRQHLLEKTRHIEEIW
jgi:hypothetical protein